MNYHKLFICELSVKLKSNDYGKEAKSIGDCGEDCSSCTHSIFDCVRNNELLRFLGKPSVLKIR